MSDKNSQTPVIDPLDNATAEFNLTVAEDGLTVSGSLKYGILHNNKWHYDFAMHLLTVREDMAIDTQLEGQARLLESYALSLDHLGGIPAEQISADILADGLVSTDFDALFFAQELLAKKRLRPSSTATV